MRPSIDQVLMANALQWEQRSTCSRNHVGVVIAKDGRSLMSGYNGAPAGMPHCEHPVSEIQFGGSGPLAQRLVRRVGDGEGCRISVHGEANALAYCARFGIAVEGGTLYSTLSPCYACSQLIISAGLIRVVYGRAYRDSDGINLLRTAGLTVEQLS